MQANTYTAKLSSFRGSHKTRRRTHAHTRKEINNSVGQQQTTADLTRML